MMKKTSPISAALAAVLSVLSGLAHGGDRPRAVVELFTSQGCSSCPAADRILSDYAKDGDVLALSWHVDYWNYLGWEDTFSKPAFTDRQQRYAVSFNRRGVYTPQAVVNGRDHAVGSKRPEIERLIESYANSGKALSVALETTKSGDELKISAIAAKGAADDATLWLIYFDPQKTVEIKRGENRGETITYHNVVREYAALGMMKDGSLDVSLPLAEMRRQGYKSCALLLQKTTASGTPGAIVGATIIPDLD